MAPILFKAGLLSLRDRSALAALCATWARWTEAEARVQELGAVITTPGGQQQKSPWLSIADQQLKLLDRWASHFGLSPASRARVTVDAAVVKRSTPNPWATVAGRDESGASSTMGALERLRANRQAAENARFVDPGADRPSTVGALAKPIDW